ncbi:hypothetical protein [Pseudomonas sp. B21-035]|uniref:hypothetical protein n=1 Tax=Pseudomonas sp. B21-035 TaxID=2895484 RepID=UPI002160C90F|nr:hypothetical protein [Pseudomonas sp. B21-035]UVL57626.1 hypothetical protein LOY22_06535 [Pseudomonas sp. B21-035]
MTEEEGHLLDPTLTDDHRFPSAFSGRSLFVKGEDWQNNAMLGWTGFPADLYATGYKGAADALLFALSQRRVQWAEAHAPRLPLRMYLNSHDLTPALVT